MTHHLDSLTEAKTMQTTPVYRQARYRQIGTKFWSDWMDVNLTLETYGDLESENRDLYTSPFGRAELDAIAEVMRQTLLDYRQSEVMDDLGCGYPLTDALTCEGHSIDMGMREIDNIVDEVMGAIKPLLTSPDGEHR